MSHAHSAEEIRLIKADLDQLRAFERSDIVTPLVKREIEATIHRVEDTLRNEEKEQGVGPARVVVPHIDLYYESGSGMHPLGRVDVNTPISHLKTLLVGKSNSFQNSERVRVERTGRVLGLGSSASVADSGLCTGDVLFPEYHRPKEVEVMSASNSEMDLSNAGLKDERDHFYRLVVSSGCFPQSPFEAVVAATHYYLLSCTDLMCLSATPNSVPGFAPSVRELPRHQFLPPKWNDSRHAVILNYRSKSKPKLTFKCECYLELDSVSVGFGYKDAPREGASHHHVAPALNSIDVPLADYINTQSPAFQSMSKTKQEFQIIFENEDALFECFPELLSGFEFLLKAPEDVAPMKHSLLLSEEHLPGISGGGGHRGGPGPALYDTDSLVKVDSKSITGIGIPSPASSGSNDSSPAGPHHYPRRTASPLSPITPLHAIPPSSGDWKREGSRETPSDLPWAAASPSKNHSHTSVGADDLFPNCHHGIASLEPLHPGGGMMMGPGHPAFHQGEHGDQDLFRGGGIRDARHDPIVPPVSGGTGLEPDLFGGDLHARPPKGKHKAKLQPGEPNPDHFRPPSWNSGSGFI